MLAVLLAISTSALSFDLAAASSNALFSDHFEGTAVDPAKWLVQENTNMSGNPAYGGSVQAANSSIILSSNGSTFPCVYSAANPFPETGDFAIEFDLTYSHISDFGDGLWMTSGPKWTIPLNGSSSTVVFQLWADNNVSYTMTRMFVALLGKEVWTSYVYGWEADAPTRLFKLTYTNGVYAVFVDGIQVASAPSQVRPNSIGFGHPPIYYLPYSAQHLSTVVGGWTRFRIDHIRMLEPAIISAGTFQTTVYMNIQPNPAGVGQTVRINISISPSPPTSNDRFDGLVLSVTRPDGSREMKGPFFSDPTGSWFILYAPTLVGTYRLQFNYSGQFFAGSNMTYLPASSAPYMLLVQEPPLNTTSPSASPSTPPPTFQPFPNVTETPPSTSTPTPTATAAPSQNATVTPSPTTILARQSSAPSAQKPSLSTTTAAAVALALVAVVSAAILLKKLYSGEK